MNLKTDNKGFTLIELLIVIVVIAILAAISVVAYTGFQNRAKNTSAFELASQVERKARAYQALEGSLPEDVANGEFIPAATEGDEAKLEGLNVGSGTSSTDSDFTNGKMVLYDYDSSGDEATITYRKDKTVDTITIKQ